MIITNDGNTRFSQVAVWATSCGLYFYASLSVAVAQPSGWVCILAVGPSGVYSWMKIEPNSSELAELYLVSTYGFAAPHERSSSYNVWRRKNGESKGRCRERRMNVKRRGIILEDLCSNCFFRFRMILKLACNFLLLVGFCRRMACNNLVLLCIIYNLNIVSIRLREVILMIRILVILSSDERLYIMNMPLLTMINSDTYNDYEDKCWWIQNRRKMQSVGKPRRDRGGCAIYSRTTNASEEFWRSQQQSTESWDIWNVKDSNGYFACFNAETSCIANV